MTRKDFWTDGRRGGVVHVEVEERNGNVICSAERDHITDRQLRVALRRLYATPFHIWEQDGYVFARSRGEDDD